MARIGNVTMHQIDDPALNSVLLDWVLPVELAPRDGLRVSIQGDDLTALFEAAQPASNAESIRELRALQIEVDTAMSGKDAAQSAVSAVLMGREMHRSKLSCERLFRDELTDHLHTLLDLGIDIAVTDIIENGEQRNVIALFDELTRLALIEHDAIVQFNNEYAQTRIEIRVYDEFMVIPLEGGADIIIDDQDYQRLLDEVRALYNRMAPDFIAAARKSYFGDSDGKLNTVPRYQRWLTAANLWRNRSHSAPEHRQWEQLQPLMAAWSTIARSVY